MLPLKVYLVRFLNTKQTKCLQLRKKPIPILKRFQQCGKDLYVMLLLSKIKIFIRNYKVVYVFTSKIGSEVTSFSINAIIYLSTFHPILHRSIL